MRLWIRGVTADINNRYSKPRLLRPLRRKGQLAHSPKH